jgi:DNA-binding NarL/FixJ family response regulator
VERILIIEEQPLLRMGARHALAEVFNGAAIEESTAREATAAVQQQIWNLVVLGLASPGVDGLSLLSQVRAAASAVPILLLSPEADAQYAVAALRLGAMATVSKSAPVEELVNAARLAILGRRYVTAPVAELLLLSAAEESVQTAPHRSLSPSEHTVFFGLVSGRSVTDIARSLDRSPKTVSTLRARIFRKLHVKTNVDLVHYAMRHNLLGREAP